MYDASKQQSIALHQHCPAAIRQLHNDCYLTLAAFLPAQ